MLSPTEVRGVSFPLPPPHNLQVTIPVPKDLHRDDGRPKALQLETAAIDVKNFSLDTLLKEETFNSAIDKFKTGWLFTTPQTQFPHFDGDLMAIPDRLKQLLNYRLRMQMLKRQGGSPVNPPYNSELMATEGWHIHTSCVHVAFVESFTHQATLHTKTFIQDFPLHFWVFLPSENTTSPPSPSSDQKEPTFSFIAHAPDVVHAELERLQLLFIMRLKDSFTDFKTAITKLLTFKSLQLSAQGPSEDLAQPADRLTTPTSSEEGEERGRRGDAEREEGGERGGDAERTSSRSSTPSRSNKLKDISASIGGCVIVRAIVADIKLPTLYSASNSRQTTSIPEEIPSPSETIRSEVDLVPKNILPSLTPSPRISPSGSQSSLTGSHASSSVSSSVASLPVVSEPSCPPTPPPDALTHSHYSSAVNVRVPPAAKTQHLHGRSLSASNLPTVAYMAPSMLSSIPPPPSHLSPSPLSQSARAETSSSGTVVQERKASEDVSTSSPSSALAVNPHETDSKPSSLHSSTSDIPSSTRDRESVEEFVMVDSPPSNPPDPGHTDTQIQTFGMLVELENVVAGTKSSQTKDINKPEQHKGGDRTCPESRQNGSRSTSRASSRLSLGSKRAKSPPTIHVEPKNILRIEVEHLYALPTVQASSSDITVRASAGRLQLREIQAKNFEESQSLFGSSRSGRSEAGHDEGSNPEIKVRFELGGQIKRFFPNVVDLKTIDAIVVAKVEGLSTSLLAPSGPLLKDFFSDEYEAFDPIPIHLKFENTEITLKDELQHTADEWTSLTVRLNHANIRRGREVEGVDLFLDGGRLELGSSETLPCGDEETDSSQSNKELLQSFRSFIGVFEAHVSQHGERLILPRPDHVAGLLHELRSSLPVEEQVATTTGAPPSYSEVISETRSRSQSIAAEIQRLRRENEELRRSQMELDRQVSDFDMVTEECKKVKDQLVAYKQVIEKQQLQIEGLAGGQNVDTRMLSISYHPPH